ncbi:MAG TPA: N,N-dimethylformamidase beta subunit family domain-containing protein [Bauldia sp.]|nr:N,N-dimethylformamidase beta subunit family domain-containing protein [Bauldia sp.]
MIWAIGEAGQPATLALAFAADGRIVVEAAGKQIASTQRPVRSRQWYGVLVTVDGEAARLDVSSAVGDRYAIEHIEHVSGAVRPGGTANLLRIGRDVAANVSDSFNGKVARPGVASGALAADPRRLLESDVPLTGQIVVEWDFALRPETDVVAARGAAGLDGRLTNLPGRAMTGPFWQPAAGQLFALSSHHDAIHFHADDVGDLHWKPTLQLRLPENLESGFYAIRVSGSDGYMHVPLFVRPKTPGARVVFLASTNTYLAYANHRMFFGNDALHELIATHPVVPNDRDVLVLDRPFLGRSLYDLHDDGSGVHMASWNRPLISLEPEARDFLAAGPRNYQADLYVIGWLRRHDMPFDVITDEDLDREGVAVLAPYDVVIAGGHPEYWSRRMLEGLQQRLRTGGKLMYLGGNGFYWAVGYNPDRTALEVRRGAGGTRPWEVSSGEIMLSTTGEAGGAWRTLGLAPQSVVGIGFASQGWGGGRGYRRLSDSLDPRVASFFDGIAKDEIIGDFGIVMNGAAGDEVDRIDYNLGTPAHTLRLATSLPFPDQYQLAVDDIRNMTPTYGGSQTELVRADIVWFDLPNGGEVFSVGSVSWPAAIGWNEGDNNVDRLSTNVLRAFLERAPKR